jgi:serine protease Do
MPAVSRYTRLVRRTSFLSVTLLGLSLVPAVALAGPPSKQAPSRQVVNVQRGGQVTIVVAPPAQQAPAPRALADKDEKAEEKAEKAEKADKKEDPIDKARRGVVTIERAGEIVGMGTVLQNDGRILTALSPLGDGNNLAIRYADGSTVKTKVAHSDRLWDMAMLVPQVGKWSEGLVPSDVDPTKQGEKLHSFSPGKSKPQVGPVSIKGRKSFLGADETTLSNAFDLGTKLGARDIGSPIVDDQGNVVAMVGRACVPVEKGPCAPSPFGVPVRSVRRFLSSAPPSAVRPAPFLGIQGALDKASAVPGVKVAGVFPESPADEAGVKAAHDKNPGDTIVAVDDHPVTTPSALSEAIMQKSVGDRVKLLLFGNGKFRETTVVLQPPPSKK